MLDADTPLRHDILMMTEFRLTDNKQEIKNAIRIEIPKNRIIMELDLFLLKLLQKKMKFIM